MFCSRVQNCENSVNRGTRKSKEEGKEVFMWSIVAGQRYENEELNEKAVKYEDIITTVKDYETIRKTKKKSIFFIPYRLGHIVKSLKEADNL